VAFDIGRRLKPIYRKRHNPICEGCTMRRYQQKVAIDGTGGS